MTTIQEACERAGMAILEGDTEALEHVCQATPEVAVERFPNGHPTILQLVACEAKNLPDPDGATRALAAAGADLDGPLVAAAGCGSLSVLETLLGLGASIDGTNEWTPLDEAIYWTQREEAAFLINHGANTNRLRRAAGLGNADATAAFFDGDQLSASAGPLASPFESAIAADDRDIIDHAFVMAVNAGHHTTAELLLGRGARINQAPPGYHWKGTALHAAVWRGEIELVQWLLDNGADQTIKDGLANSDALGWARHHEHPAIAELLEKR